MDSTGQSELAAVGRAIRAVYVQEPEPEVAEGHLAAILAEAERVTAAGADTTIAPVARRRIGRRGSLALRLAAVVASAFVASAGLAIAGVRPPEPFSDVFEGLGFDVPGSDESSTDEHAPVTGESAPPSGPPGAQPGGGGGATSATESSRAPGDTGDRTGQRSEQGTDASSEGRETAEEAQNGSTPPSQPGRSEEQPSPPTGLAPQSQSESSPLTETPSGSGESPAENSGGGGQDPPSEPPPEPLIDPEPSGPGQSGGAGQSAVAPGLAVSGGNRPVEKPDGGEDAVDPPD